jgi:hypothetical protein
MMSDSVSNDVDVPKTNLSRKGGVQELATPGKIHELFELRFAQSTPKRNRPNG